MRHTDFATMFEYAAGLGTKAARVGLEAHLRACERCARDAATARRLVETVRADRMSEPPRTLVQRAILLWRQERPGRARRAIEVLKAVLTFDSLTFPPSAAVRTAETSRVSTRTRRLLYSARDFDIDLAVERPPTRRGRARLRGQILSRSPGATLPAGSKARLRRLGGGGAVVELDCH